MIQYKNHDATKALFERTMIVHVCNNINVWSQGFVVALANRYPIAKKAYHTQDQTLSTVQFVSINKQLLIANMIAQRGILSHDNPVPLDMKALENTLEIVYRKAQEENYKIQMPRIGSGLAGGDWDEIEALITQYANKYQVQTVICLFT